MAICRYFEALHPEPALMGTTAEEKALIEMWHQRAYDGAMGGAAEVFRNTHPAFVDRSLPGYAVPLPQIQALVARGHQRLDQFFSIFDRQLANNPFVAGDRFSLADITALCSTDFAKFAGVSIPDQCAHFARWYAQVSARPSARA